jgi:hypothetical protein
VTDVELIAIIAVAVSFSTTVLIAVLSSRAVTDAYRTLDRAHQSHARQVDGLLNRLQAVRWEDFAALQTTLEEGADVGGYYPPEDETETGQYRPNFLGNMRRQSTNSSSEDTLIDEDFDETGSPRREP